MAKWHIEWFTRVILGCSKRMKTITIIMTAASPSSSPSAFLIRVSTSGRTHSSWESQMVCGFKGLPGNVVQQVSILNYLYAHGSKCNEQMATLRPTVPLCHVSFILRLVHVSVAPFGIRLGICQLQITAINIPRITCGIITIDFRFYL